MTFTIGIRSGTRVTFPFGAFRYKEPLDHGHLFASEADGSAKFVSDEDLARLYVERKVKIVGFRQPNAHALFADLGPLESLDPWEQTRAWFVRAWDKDPCSISHAAIKAFIERCEPAARTGRRRGHAVLWLGDAVDSRARRDRLPADQGDADAHRQGLTGLQIPSIRRAGDGQLRRLVLVACELRQDGRVRAALPDDSSRQRVGREAVRRLAPDRRSDLRDAAPAHQQSRAICDPQSQVQRTSRPAAFWRPGRSPPLTSAKRCDQLDHRRWLVRLPRADAGSARPSDRLRGGRRALARDAQAPVVRPAVARRHHGDDQEGRRCVGKSQVDHRRQHLGAQIAVI